MATRRRSADDDISLFPFLSIVACVIGVLTMMIATLALAQTDTPDVAKIEEYESLQKDIKASEDSIEELTQRIKVSKSSVLHLREQQQQLALTSEELLKLQEELRKTEEEIAKQKKIEIIVPEVDKKARETATQMQAELEAAQEQLAQLEKDLQKRNDVPTEGDVTVLPQGSGLTFRPHFVECAAGSAVLHNLETPKRIRTGEAVKDKDFLALLNLVANGKDDTIIFLVRSDGLSTYYALRTICRNQDVRNGKIPVVGKGRIDLSAFVKKSEKN